MRRSIGFALALAVVAGVAAGTPAQTRTPEATSLAGQPLYPPAELSNREKLEADLAQAEKALAANPTDADAIIWVGRRQAYLWRYRDAVETYTKGIALHPDNPKLYRHRGHRYITLRQFDKAVADFQKAVSLIKGQADEIEPDGAPNRFNKPRSTLHFNIYYHLGLAHYLRAEYEDAARAYEACMQVSNNDDSVVATSDWQWMTLMRLGRKAEAAKVLERIGPEMDILENDSYHKRLLMYKGLAEPSSLLDPANADDLTIATQGYGVGNYHYVTGNVARAREVFQKVVGGRQWAAFGYIAAEADLQRMK